MLFLQAASAAHGKEVRDKAKQLANQDASIKSSMDNSEQIAYKAKLDEQRIQDEKRTSMSNAAHEREVKAKAKELGAWKEGE